MRTTLNLEDDLVDRARRLTGIDEKTALVQKVLDADDYVSGTYFDEHLQTGQPRANQLPLNLAIVDFPG